MFQYFIQYLGDKMGKFYVGVKAIIKNSDKILLIKRSDKYKADSIQGIWDIPGGRINFGEEPIDGLKREIYEETGLELDEIKQILDASTIFIDEERHIVRITYLCTVKSSEVNISEEHTDMMWIEPSKIDFKLKDHLIEKVINLN